MLTAILFDLDGTLVNTDPLHYQTWQDVLRNYGLEIDQAFYNARISGRLNPVIIQDLLPHLSVEEGIQLADYKEARFREIGSNLAPLAGLPDVLAWSKRHNLKQAVVTNAPRKNVDFVLKVLELTDIFDAVVLAEEVTAGKPDPASYKFVLSQLGISKEAAIAFEDSPSGIEAAVAAGIYTIGVASTHNPQHLLEAGAAIAISDFQDSQLWELLPSLMEKNAEILDNR